MRMLKTRKSEHHRQRVKGRKNPPAVIGVSVRKQTPQEERQFTAAFRLFLIEIVRQDMSRRKE